MSFKKIIFTFYSIMSCFLNVMDNTITSGLKGMLWLIVCPLVHPYFSTYHKQTCTLGPEEAQLYIVSPAYLCPLNKTLFVPCLSYWIMPLCFTTRKWIPIMNGDASQGIILPKHKVTPVGDQVLRIWLPVLNFWSN